MKVVIIEDEKLAADRLAHLVKECDTSVEVIAMLDSIKESVQYLEKNKSEISLIFIDIHLADGLSFEIFDHLDITIPVIFTTAYNEYALKAFQVNSVDYLLKPINQEALRAAIEKFRMVNLHYQAINKESMLDIKNTILREEKKRFVVKTGNHIQSIPVENICCFCSKEKVSFIYTMENKKYPIDYSLEQVETLVSDKLFFRINRKFILNINAIKDVVSYSNSRLKVVVCENVYDEDLVVSREKVGAFKTWLGS